jgi:hypothetical protein
MQSFYNCARLSGAACAARAARAVEGAIVASGVLVPSGQVACPGNARSMPAPRRAASALLPDPQLQASVSMTSQLPVEGGRRRCRASDLE